MEGYPDTVRILEAALASAPDHGWPPYVPANSRQHNFNLPVGMLRGAPFLKDGLDLSKFIIGSRGP